MNTANTIILGALVLTMLVFAAVTLFAGPSERE